MGALFLHLKPDEYLKKLYKTKKLVEKTSFSLQAEVILFCEHFANIRQFLLIILIFYQKTEFL
ncbi:hypothetical protein [Bacillus subtilis]|uniref:hypothetical protein n=1 Tax=Bacillus subtilis TaxID=1423 RepID=UPI002B4C10C6|nr:hypothetical protein [Bacillus subtilis]WRK86843.1 hypothetical protein U7118_16955 [Bacillus subtilis]WRS92662.1 hypothetical protein VDS57_15575 [Bacillus subtilis]